MVVPYRVDRQSQLLLPRGFKVAPFVDKIRTSGGRATKMGYKVEDVSTVISKACHAAKYDWTQETTLKKLAKHVDRDVVSISKAINAFVSDKTLSERDAQLALRTLQAAELIGDVFMFAGCLGIKKATSVVWTYNQVAVELNMADGKVRVDGEPIADGMLAMVEAFRSVLDDGYDALTGSTVEVSNGHSFSVFRSFTLEEPQNSTLFQSHSVTVPHQPADIALV